MSVILNRIKIPQRFTIFHVVHHQIQYLLRILFFDLYRHALLIFQSLLSLVGVGAWKWCWFGLGRWVVSVSVKDIQ